MYDILSGNSKTLYIRGLSVIVDYHYFYTDRLYHEVKRVQTTVTVDLRQSTEDVDSVVIKFTCLKNSRLKR